MNLIKRLCIELEEFQKELDTFGSTANSTKVNIKHSNNFDIISTSFSCERYLITLLSMKHINSNDFEPSRAFSELRKNGMNICNGNAYILNNDYHFEIYDKSDFFNMSVTGELVCDFRYEYYELFNELRDLRKGLNYTSIEIHLRFNDECA